MRVDLDTDQTIELESTSTEVKPVELTIRCVLAPGEKLVAVICDKDEMIWVSPSK